MLWLLAWRKKINEEKFLAFVTNEDEIDGIQITNILTSVTENVTSVEFAYVEEEM